MARHRRTLEEQLADMVGQGRASAGITYSTPAMAPITVDHLDADLANNLDAINTELTAVTEDLAEVDQKITDALAVPISNERFTEDSISIWPFVQNVIPSGALAPGAVNSGDLADFVITARKFNDSRHRLY